MATPPINSLRALKESKSPDAEKVTKGTSMSVHPSLLLEEEGYNSRGVFVDGYFERPEVVAYIRGLAESYKAGAYVPPIVVKVKDGKPYVRDGHCRLRGLKIAIAEGAQIERIDVLELKGDEAKQVALIVSSDNKLPLTALERAVNYGRLSAWGWSDAKIAAEIGRTAEHVRQLRALLELPIELKRLMQEGVVAATLAAELYAAHGDKAVDMVKSGQTNSGKERITKKDIGKEPAAAVPRRRPGKKLVEAMWSSVSALPLDNLKIADDGQCFVMTLTREEVEQLQALKADLAALKSDESDASESPADDAAQQQIPLEE